MYDSIDEANTALHNTIHSNNEELNQVKLENNLLELQKMEIAK